MEQKLTPDDTITAIATPAGTGGIAVIRISGSQALSITQKIWKGKKLESCRSHTAHLGQILSPDGETIDEALLTIFLAPHSFTGEDTVEISCHGSSYIQRAIIHSLIHAGARLARHGEFSQRAFLNGRIDLTQAEAIADLISASGKAAHRVAMSQIRGDFSSRLNQIRNSLVDLASLLELELDFSEEDVEFLFRFIDTAGIRHTDDTIERLGIERSRLALASARIILHVIDSTAPRPVSLDDAPSDARIITVYNKTDIAGPATYSADDTIAISATASAADGTAIAISALTGQGLDDLRRLIADTARRDTAAGDEDAILITNARHADALRSAAVSARALLDGLRTTTPADLLAQDLRETLHHLATITGQITTTEILQTIFTTFCIGK